MKGSLQLAAMLACGVVAAACTAPDNRAGSDQAAMASPSPTTGAYGTGETGRTDDQPSAGDIAGNPTRYEGQHVTLKADVEKVLPNGMFQLDDNDLLVLSPSGQPSENQNVTVSGTVHTYSAPELKNRYTWFRSDEQADSEYKNKPVIVADSIMTADGRELLTAGSSLPAGTGETGSKKDDSGRPADRP